MAFAAGGVSAVSNRAARLNVWVYVVVTQAGGVGNLFWDSVVVGTVPMARIPRTSRPYFGVGAPLSADPFGRPFDGMVDDVRLWSVALSLAQINTNALSFVASAFPGCLLWYAARAAMCISRGGAHCARAGRYAYPM